MVFRGFHWTLTSCSSIRVSNLLSLPNGRASITPQNLSLQEPLNGATTQKPVSLRFEIASIISRGHDAEPIFIFNVPFFVNSFFLEGTEPTNTYILAILFYLSNLLSEHPLNPNHICLLAVVSFNLHVLIGLLFNKDKHTD